MDPPLHSSYTLALDYSQPGRTSFSMYKVFVYPLKAAHSGTSITLYAASLETIAYLANITSQVPFSACLRDPWLLWNLKLSAQDRQRGRGTGRTHKVLTADNPHGPECLQLSLCVHLA
ncbi:hypothetical protein PoB_000206600 [Plakobranchus ocellatus]|uniref:Uncharacterized protein n=1 Tax=Plakobranchus ocellatus TaxID=259542 RepID=A0AAV3X7L4_9GAST|nr:hypothetical protein PoB_000206600 [Plakobranchus ocellatus]